MKNFAELVSQELANARKKHPGKHHSLHEAYAVIQEEVDEFWNWVKMQTRDRVPQAMLEELTQIGAMAQRAAEDLGLL